MTFVRTVGRVLIAVGALMLLFVAYQLWGTDFIAERNQRKLEAQIEQSWDKSATEPSPPPPAGPALEPAGVAIGPPQAPPKLELGSGVASIEIPAIDLRSVVVEGVSVEALKRGPGHLPSSAYPGQKGNVVISGHRSTYGAPFSQLDKVTLGDSIRVRTAKGSWAYRVVEKKIVAPDQVSVIAPTAQARLTLTTCHPRYSARQRLIVIGELVGPAQQAA